MTEERNEVLSMGSIGSKYLPALAGSKDRRVSTGNNLNGQITRNQACSSRIRWISISFQVKNVHWDSWRILKDH